MKLKGFLEQAVADGKAGVITKGGPWSNHLHACAWICRELGLTCHAWVKGHGRTTGAMLEDIAGWNAGITYVNRTTFYDEQQVTQVAAGNNLLYIPMGGAEERGIKHVSQFIEELHLPLYHYAICAVGTATTFGGLAFLPGNYNNVIGVDAGTRDDSVHQKTRLWQDLLPDKTLSLVYNYTFDGFARHTPELTRFMNVLFAGHGIPTDIVYTGKLFYAVQDLVNKNHFPAGARLIVVHSGGLQGNRSLPAGTLEF